MDQVISDHKVIIQKQGPLGRIVLNRPKALNALDLDMIREISFALEMWRHDESVKAVFIEGAGDRAFCAGGDIKGFYMAGMDYRRGRIGLDVAVLFFDEEYAMNKSIFHYPKPVISYMDGITMGGGFGVGGHAKYKIISEKTVFAMPEARIGFFPDIGSMYYLRDIPHHIGNYLALTGNTISADDMVYCGLAAYQMKPEQKTEMVKVLLDALQSGAPDDKVAEVLSPYIAVNGNNAPIARRAEAINVFYAESNVNALLEALENANEAARSDHSVISRNSPISVFVANDYIKRCKNMGFDEIIKTDLMLARHFIQGRDFYEGIRAAVIDKDKNPVWENKGFDEISLSEAEGYFSG